MAEQKKKIKLLYVMKILLEQTDENHKLNALDIVDKLASEYNIETERKSIYKDVELLKEFGLDIVQEKGSNPGYYVYGREFEVPELKLLVDAVQASKFISKKKSDALIAKLEGLTSIHSAGDIHRQVRTTDRVKSDNETVFYNIDYIHNAIQTDRQISFDYYAWTPAGKLVEKKDGRYIVSPWCMVWDDENYYLVCYDQTDRKIKYFRVDKMKKITANADKREGKSQFKDFDMAKFSKKTFGMFGGRDETVRMTCQNNMAGVIIDRFGKDIHLAKVDDDHFRMAATVTVSGQFFGWITGLGGSVVITGPESVVEEYKKHLSTILEAY